MSVSIIIATADRSRCVLDCVSSFAGQVPSDVELIVVDAGKDDPVEETLLRELWPNSRLIRAGERNASMQRNLGVAAAQTESERRKTEDSGLMGSAGGATQKAAHMEKDLATLSPCHPATQSGLQSSVFSLQSSVFSLQSSVFSLQSSVDNIVIFLDDDVIVLPGWWPGILEPLKDPQVAVVQGGIWNSLSPRLRNDRGGFVRWNGIPEACFERSSIAPRELEWAMTGNVAVRKSVYEEVGGLDPYFVVYEEDVDFGLRVRKAGYRIVHEPDASVYHYGHRLWRPPRTKQQSFRLTRNHSYMLFKNFGWSSRSLAFVLLQPWRILGSALKDSMVGTWRIWGHAMAQLLGMVKGAWDGRR